MIDSEGKGNYISSVRHLSTTVLGLAVHLFKVRENLVLQYHACSTTGHIVHEISRADARAMLAVRSKMVVLFAS